MQRVEAHHVGPHRPHLVEPSPVKGRIVRKLGGEFPREGGAQVHSFDEHGTKPLPHLDLQLAAAGPRDHPHGRALRFRRAPASFLRDFRRSLQLLQERLGLGVRGIQGQGLRERSAGRRAIFLVSPRHPEALPRLRVFRIEVRGPGEMLGGLFRALLAQCDVAEPCLGVGGAGIDPHRALEGLARPRRLRQPQPRPAQKRLQPRVLRELLHALLQQPH